MKQIREEVYNNEKYWGALQMMANRMAFSEQKYGPIENNYPHNFNSLEISKQRIEMYRKTGNTEWLLDAANQIIIEFLLPRHEEAHFRATDSDESPGLET